MRISAMIRFETVEFETIKKWIYGYWHRPAAFSWEQKPIRPLFTFKASDDKQNGVVYLQARFDREFNDYVVDMNSQRWINKSDLFIDINIDANVAQACEAAEVIYHHNMKKREVIRNLREKPDDA